MNVLYGLRIRLKALRSRRDKAAAAHDVAEVERIHADVMRVEAMIAEREGKIGGARSMKPRMTDVVLPPTFEQTARAGIAAHTPGPWAVHPDAPFEVVQNDGDVCPLVAAVIAEGCDEEQAKADASLIAAAPELLAALEYAHNHIMNPDNTDLSDLYRTIRVAIAAAKGGAL